MKHLVTGGCGFIGGHIVDELIKQGHSVIVIDDLSSEGTDKFHFNNSNFVSYHHLDIRNFDEIFPLFENVDTVFHLAAESRIQPIINNPRLAVDTNLMGTCNILEASRLQNVRRVIYSSTSAIYGLKNTPPLNESMESDCLNSYAVSKKLGEDLCKMYSALWNIQTVIFRYFNVYGERNPTKGQYAPVIGRFLDQHKQGLPMTVVGTGGQKRDFVSINDVVRANIMASESNNPDIIGEILNVGTGKNYSILELAHMIGDNIEFIPQRMGESWETLADIKKIQSLLQWEPQFFLEDWIQSQK